MTKQQKAAKRAWVAIYGNQINTLISKFNKLTGRDYKTLGARSAHGPDFRLVRLGLPDSYSRPPDT